MPPRPARPSASSRRTFLRWAAPGGLLASTYRRVLGANEKIGVGFIGFGLIGKRHVLDFKADPEADLRAVAEVHTGRLDEAAALIGGPVQKYGDFRSLLDDKSIDAV